MFNDCRALISIDNISEKKIGSYMNISNMFNNCSSLISIKLDIKTHGTKSMKNLFQGCSSLKSLPDISSWNTEDVVEMKNMFKD